MENFRPLKAFKAVDFASGSSDVSSLKNSSYSPDILVALNLASQPLDIHESIAKIRRPAQGSYIVEITVALATTRGPSRTSKLMPGCGLSCIRSGRRKRMRAIPSEPGAIHGPFSTVTMPSFPPVAGSTGWIQQAAR